MNIEGLILGNNIFSVKNPQYKRAINKLRSSKKATWKDYQRLELQFKKDLMTKLNNQLLEMDKLVTKNIAPKGNRCGLDCTNPDQHVSDLFDETLLKLVAVVYGEEK
jgi:hypothetical protein